MGDGTRIEEKVETQLASARSKYPAMHQNLHFNLSCSIFRRTMALKDVFEIAIRIVPVELGGLDETHDRGGTLTSSKPRQ